MGNHSIIIDGEREIIVLQNCCPFHNCDECTFRGELVGAIEKILKDNPKWWK